MDRTDHNRNVNFNNLFFLKFLLFSFSQALNVVTNQPNKKTSKTIGKIIITMNI